jgi:uncharacterized protein YcsI (UPF0317 family)
VYLENFEKQKQKTMKNVRSYQTKDYTIYIGSCRFSTKHAGVRSEIRLRDWLARNQYNASEWDKRLSPD